MMKIKKLVEQIDEELEGAKHYAEKYVEYKADGNPTWANKFKDMANDELRHAMNIHELAIEEINKLKVVYPNPPTDMMEKWEASHKEYVEKAAWIKMMLGM